MQRLYYVHESHGIVVTDLAFLPRRLSGRSQEAALLSVAVDSRCQVHTVRRRSEEPPPPSRPLTDMLAASFSRPLVSLIGWLLCAVLQDRPPCGCCWYCPPWWCSWPSSSCSTSSRGSSESRCSSKREALGCSNFPPTRRCLMAAWTSSLEVLDRCSTEIISAAGGRKNRILDDFFNLKRRRHAAVCYNVYCAKSSGC